MKAASVFSDNMVIQAHRCVCIFGECSDNEQITVSAGGNTVKAFTGAGRFEAILPPMDYADDITVTISSDSGECVTFTNVAVGEVWLAGGQSNMEFELHSDKHGAEELKNCANEKVRYYYTNKIATVGEQLFQAESNTCWMMPSEQNSVAWSAAAYYFAKNLSRKLGVTVGVIGCNWGGTSASCWMPREYLTRRSELRPYIDDYEKATLGKSEEQMKAEYEEYLDYQGKWEKKMQACYAENPGISWNEVQRICGENRYPGPPGCTNPMRPCGLFDTMVKRVSPYTIRGVLWYQGESDDHRPDAYYSLMTSLIECWRRQWRDEELPFIMVQLPMFRYAEDPDYKHWCIIRQAQMKVFRTIKNTGLAVALDCGEFNNIHPVDKSEVGKRLYLQAMSEVYGLMERRDTLPPMYREFYTSGEKAVLLFDNAEGGTALEGWQEDFEISGSDGKWYRADTGSFIGDKICISSQEVSQPAAVRYQWTNYAEVRLFGKNGLPVPPLNTLGTETVSDGSEGTVIRII